jgi:ribosomal protein S21
MANIMINAEVVKNNNENNLNLIRRFTKKVQGSGVLPRVRSIRYATRKQSEYVKKKKTLKVLKRRAEVDELIKMGKMVEFTRGGKR